MSFLTELDSLKNAITNFVQRLTTINGNPGEVAIIKRINNASSLTFVKLVQKIYLANTDAAVTSAKTNVGKIPIIDTRTNTYWYWDTTTLAWVNSGTTITSTVFQRGIFYKDVLTFATIFADLDGSLISLGTTASFNY